MSFYIRTAAWALGLLLTLAAPVAFAQESYSERDGTRTRTEAPTATFTVAPGQSIQAAVDRAAPGDRIQLLPGVYHESVTIDFDDIELVGVIENGRRAVLDGKNEMNDAILVSGHNFVIQGIEMRNYKANGVVVNQAKNATFRDLIGVNCGKYAIYPVQCDGVLIENSVVTDVWDAGIYAGQCKNVEIRNNVVYRNTIGIEAENSDNVVIRDNTAFNNSLGILVVLLPNLPSKSADTALVINNRVLANNYPNNAPPGNVVAFVQPGQGILIAGADRTEITGNEIADHNSVGIVVASITDSLQDGQQIGDQVVKIDIEPHTDHVFIHGNRYSNNGGGPLAKQFASLGFTRGFDLVWSGKGVGNVWDEPGATAFPPALPGPGNPSGSAPAAPAAAAPAGTSPAAPTAEAAPAAASAPAS